MLRAPEYISSLSPYVPGKPLEELQRELGIERPVKLASNENPLGPSPLALRAAQQALRDIHRYPDGGGYYLRQALSRHTGVPPQCIILGAGANELIDLAIRTYLRPGEEAVMATPSFPIYRITVKAQGGVAVEVPLKGHRHDLEAMARAIGARTRLLFIANPNNPTGTIVAKEELEALMQRLHEDMLVVLDEAYREYVDEPSYPEPLGYIREGRNILVLRSFSKAYGLAGLRIGYGLARQEIIQEMNKVRPPFNTSSVAQAAALAALQDAKHLERSRRLNREGKEFLYREFEALGIEYVPTQANFIYVLRKGAPELYEKLLMQGVIVRPVGPQALRISIGLREENQRLVQALRRILEGGS
jgi:histidinol-phosphate aminotransferase